MSFTSLLRSPAFLGAIGITNLLGLCGNTYLLRAHMVELSEDHEARMVCKSFHLSNQNIVQVALQRPELKLIDACVCVIFKYE
jgi:hypothetical protein